MSHKREDIRKAVLALLATPVVDVYPTLAGANVYANRVTTAFQTELPMIKIFCGPESAEPRSINSRQYIRTLTLLVEILVEATDDLDDTMDDIALEVETLILSNPSLSGNASGTFLINSEPSIEDGGEKPVGKLTITFETKYIA